MLNPNSRTNTVISQSFIASEFQGFNDPFVNTKPTSSLNQFVRSKQTSDSGFIHDGQNEAFGFNNITNDNYQPTLLEKVSRKTEEQYQPAVRVKQPIVQLNQPTIGVSQNQSKAASNTPLNNNSPFYYQNQQTSKQTLIPQQPPMERYVSPGIVKQDSPVKAPYQPSSQQNDFSNRNSQQTFQSQSTVSPQSRPQSNQQGLNLRPVSIQQQKSYTQVGGSNGSNVGKGLKLNVSQQFSNSFTLNCVTQPQRSNIIEMKKRQREFRRSIQNFFK